MKISLKLKRISGIFVAAAMTVTTLAFPVKADTPVLNGDWYEIYTVSQLISFGDMVNGYGDYEGRAMPGINGRLMNDIVFQDNLFDSDGNINSTAELTQWRAIRGFEGAFDGNGKSVVGLYVPEHSDYSGFFGSTGRGSNVYNINIINSYIYGRDYVGGIVGYAGGELSGCTFSGTVAASDGTYGVGGIAGNCSMDISGCINYGTVFGACINGYGYVGGVVGTAQKTVTDCGNEGDVTCVGYSAGGVAGIASGVSGSYNNGDVDGACEVGGIVANAYGYINNCYNTGEIFTDTFDPVYKGSGPIAGVFNTAASDAADAFDSAAAGISDCCVLTVSGCSVGAVTDINNSLYACGDERYADGLSMDMFTSGMVAYTYNFGMTIGTDKLPVLLTADGENRVYRVTVTVNLPSAAELTGANEYGYANKRVTVRVTDSSYRFAGWYDADTMMSAEYSYELNPSDSELVANITLPGDMNFDGVFNGVDLLRLKKQLGGSALTSSEAADVNSDGAVDSNDVIILLNSVKKSG